MPTWAFAERWIRGIRQKCLNHFILLGMKSLRRVVAVYCRHFNYSRGRQGLANRVPRDVRTGEPPARAIFARIGRAYCEERLGGFLKAYRRAA